MRPNIKIPFKVPQKVKLVWERLTCSRLITFYFGFTVLHCIVQVVFQIMAYSMNSDAERFLNQLQMSAGLSSRNFTLYDSSTGTLESCWGIDGIEDFSSCRVIWQENPALLPANPSDYPITSDGASVPSVTTSETSVATTTASSSAIATGLPTVGEELEIGNDESDDSESDDGSSDGESSDGESLDGDDDDDDLEDELAPTSTVVETVFVRPTSTPALVKKREEGSVRIIHSKRGIFITPITGRSDSDPTNTTVTGLRIGGLGSPSSDTTSYQEHDADAVNVDLKCIQVLSWPLQRLRNTEREDLVFIVFQIWVFGVSLVALLNESIPHIAAALLTHMLATMWSGFQIAHTSEFRRNFITMTARGACDGVNLLPMYWNLRSAAEISVLVLNAVALVASAFLSWKLVHLFGWATFRRVGASVEIARFYKIVLSTSIILQLSVFFIVVSIALWIDQLYNGSIGIFAKHVIAYRVGYTLLLICMPAWLYFGWVGIRKENKWMTIGFVGFSIAIVVQWAAMFASKIWRLTFLNWAFFAIMAIVAVVCNTILIVMVIICWRNYGRGLLHYLTAHETVPENRFAPTPYDTEKAAGSFDDGVVGFPSTGLVPSYAVAFGGDAEKLNDSLEVTRPAAAVVLPSTSSSGRSSTKALLLGKAGFGRNKNSVAVRAYGEGMGKARRMTGNTARTYSTGYGEVARTYSRASVSSSSSSNSDSHRSGSHSDQSHRRWPID